MHELTLHYRSLDKLIPCPANARLHSARQVAQIAKSIEATAFANPILIDEDGVIIAGHGRLLATKKLKLAEAPVVILPGLTEVQKRLLRVADNKIALNASWDIDLLKVELQEIIVSDLDVEITGFEIGEIDVVLAGQPDPAADLVPATVESAVTKPGDIWLLGKHRLGCGDVREVDALVKLMDGAVADAAFLDPPYNVPIDGYATGREPSPALARTAPAFSCSEIARRRHDDQSWDPLRCLYAKKP